MQIFALLGDHLQLMGRRKLGYYFEFINDICPIFKTAEK